MNGRNLANLWVDYLMRIRKARALCLELMSHPDATPEQLVQAQQSLSRLMAAHRELQPKVAAKWSRLSVMPTLEK